MLLAEITETSDAVASNRSRLAKVGRLAAALRQAAPEEVLPAVCYLSGELPQRQIGVGYASLRDLPPPTADPGLTIAEVDAAFTGIGAVSGPGSVGVRRHRLHALFARATAPEQHFLARLLTGELRQGALEGVMVDAIARAAEIPATEVRRALLLRGNLAAVAQAALTAGVSALRAFHLEVGRALQPMLAQSDTAVAAALARITPAAVEWKLDGIRVQVHHAPGGEARVFTRSLDDITARVPEVVAVVRAVGERALVLDGEVIALRPDGRPHPFQITGARTRSFVDVDRLRAETPLTTFFFDLLHLDGEDWIDRPLIERYTALASVIPEELLIPRIVTADAAETEMFLRDTLARGHEGVMVKSLTASYAAGRRGAGWIKVKPVHTLDLVVLAAEWGHGRRKGWLSNLHLGARDPATGDFVMLGKTFKGLTDELLTWQTAKFQELATHDEGWVVHLRPELVVEIAFDGVQTSPRYPGGMALRFARVVRYREDKRADEADTVDTVRAIHQATAE